MRTWYRQQTAKSELQHLEEIKKQYSDEEYKEHKQKLIGLIKINKEAVDNYLVNSFKHSHKFMAYREIDKKVADLNEKNQKLSELCKRLEKVYSDIQNRAKEVAEFKSDMINKLKEKFGNGEKLSASQDMILIKMLIK